MRLADFLGLAARAPDAIAQATKLGRELVALDARRTEIVAALAELGIEDGLAKQPEIERRPAAGSRPGAAPDKSAKPLSRPEDAWRQAYEAVMARHIADFNASRREEEDEARLQRETDRRRPQIEAMAAELLNGAPNPAECAECDEPAETLIGGRGYCAAHRPPPLPIPTRH